MSWLWLIVIGTSIWVWMDASSIGARKGLIKGIADMGPFAWFLCCLFFWIIAFPVYVAKRGAIKVAAQSVNIPEQQSPSTPSPLVKQADLKNCPFCAEPIRIEAIKCKHCGSELPEA